MMLEKIDVLIRNAFTFHHRIMSRFLRNRGWVVFYLPEESREHIRTQFYRVANSPMGMYVLIDYVNFKGEGTILSERYHGQGWGLLQVLEQMEGEEAGYEALGEFARSAEFVLVRRVSNSPPARGEKRWIPGWKNRLKTYTNQTLLDVDSSQSKPSIDESPPTYESIVSAIRDMVCEYN